MVREEAGTIGIRVRKSVWMRVPECAQLLVACLFVWWFWGQIAARLPVLGGIASSLIGAGTTLVALTAALGSSAACIAAAWARFRPLHSVLLTTATAAGYFLIHTQVLTKR